MKRAAVCVATCLIATAASADFSKDGAEFVFGGSAVYGPLPDPRLSDASPASNHQLTVVVCEEGPGDLCTDLKKIRGATVIIDDREAGRTNEDGSLTTTVQRGPRMLHIAAVGYAGVAISVEVVRDTHRDVELQPTRPVTR